MEIKIDQGTVKGTTRTNLNGDIFYSFQGIPYAIPPIGKLRFKAPRPAQKWNDTLDATKDQNVPYQRDYFSKIICGSEDCLYLNIFTRKIDCLSPVLFWIPGGGLIFGSNSTDCYGPEFVLNEEVVLVTISYRLGIWGFISFKDPALEIPGNAGFKDIVLALKWVQKNIAHFGGDPNNVTIWGASMGACAAHMLALSPSTKNLFHKLILHSGTCFNTYSYGTGAIKEISKVIKLYDEHQLYNYLMQASSDELLKIQDSTFRLNDFQANSPGVYSFVVEPYETEETFLSKHPLEILASGTVQQVPIIIGYCSDESLVFALSPNKYEFHGVVPWILNLPEGGTKNQEILKKLKKYYFNNCKSSDISLKQLTTYHSDGFYNFGIFLAVFYLQKFWHKNVFFYKLKLDSKLNWMQRLNNIKFKGTTHFDDLGYFFTNFLTPDIVPGGTEDIYLRRMVRLWTNFAKFGDPTPNYDSLLKIKWESTNQELKCLRIEEKLKMDLDRYDLERQLFLKKVYGECSTTLPMWKSHL